MGGRGGGVINNNNSFNQTNKRVAAIALSFIVFAIIILIFKKRFKVKLIFNILQQSSVF